MLQVLYAHNGHLDEDLISFGKGEQVGVRRCVVFPCPPDTWSLICILSIRRTAFESTNFMLLLPRRLVLQYFVHPPGRIQEQDELPHGLAVKRHA